MTHQIGFWRVWWAYAGQQVVVACNCGWRSARAIVSLQDAWALYDAHLPEAR